MVLACHMRGYPHSGLTNKTLYTLILFLFFLFLQTLFKLQVRVSMAQTLQFSKFVYMFIHILIG